MKRFFCKTITLLIIMATLLSLVLTSCSKKEDAKAADAESTEVRKIIVGTGNGFKPYCYLDDTGKLTGYEYEVLKKVDELLPQYEFEYQTSEFKNILISLEAGKIDLGAHQFEVNPERQEKYLFAQEPYTTFVLRITVDKNRTDINGITDLHGKNVQVGEGSNDAWVLGDYNSKNDNAINLIPSAADNATTVKNIEDGRIDAFISITRIVETLNQQFGDKLKTVGEPIASSNTYYLYNKDDTQLQQDVDGALKKLKEDGTLAKLSIEILGGDYTTND